MRRLFAQRTDLANEDAVNALAFAPPRGAAVEAARPLPAGAAQALRAVTAPKPAHVPNVRRLRVLSYALDAPPPPLFARRRATACSSGAAARRPVDSGATRP